MPTYVYQCTACSLRFERFQKITDPPITTCDCGCEGTVKKVMQPVGIAFKGSGFYVNDSTGSPAGAKSEAKKAEPVSDAAPSKPEGSDGKTGVAKAADSVATPAPTESPASPTP